MARPKKPNRHNEHECRNPLCGALFDAVRDDAKYCSAACRQAMSRAVRRLMAGSNLKGQLHEHGRVQCASCGTRRKPGSKTCSVCGSVKCRKPQ